MIRITFLGTAAARPTPGRNVTGIAVQRDGELFLFDCGEGTQRQMMRYQTGFNVDQIFITHIHADHILGIPGLVRTMGLQGRTDRLTLYGPAGSRRVLIDAVHLGVERLPFEIEVREVGEGDSIDFEGWRIDVFAVVHKHGAIGFRLREDERLGRFDVNRARALGIPEGPIYGRLHRGETVEIDGRRIDPADLVGPTRPGRHVVYTGDTRPCARVVEIARHADLLIHEATFVEEERDRAIETLHSTAAEAARVAVEAEVRRLVLTHISARHTDTFDRLREEAAEIFPGARVAHDGMVIEVPFPDEETA
ncbi:MAG: ribonuclease Z [Longimicrobiales bacterium]|nr:ribonuclease Z [Longimicrobiales bacterium]